MSEELTHIVETILLASDSPVTVKKIQSLFEEDSRPEADDIKKAIEALEVECEHRGVEIRKIGQGYRYQTRPKFAHFIRKMYQTKPPKLSRALLETLAIIAYKQPVTRGDIEAVRGVSVSSEMLQRLREKDWIHEVGVRDVPGRPTLFATTNEFLSHFNLGSLKDLPDLMRQRDFTEIEKDLDPELASESDSVAIAVAHDNSDADETEISDVGQTTEENGSENDVAVDSDIEGEAIIAEIEDEKTADAETELAAGDQADVAEQSDTTERKSQALADDDENEKAASAVESVAN